VKANETEASVTLKTDEKTKFAETGWFLVAVHQGINKDVTMFSVIQFIGGSAALDWEDMEPPPGQGAYIVTFDLNGAPGEPPSPITGIIYGDRITQPDEPSWEDRIFDEWHTDKKASAPYGFDKPVTGSITLYAHWIETHRVTFYLNYVGAPEGPYHVYPSVAHGDLVLEPTAPTRTGAYGFDGWYTAASGGTEYSFSAPLTKDLKLYARWVGTHKVTFYLNYVGAPESPYYVDPSVAHGGLVLAPAAPTRTGAYVFDGWYKEAACVNPWNFATGTVTASLDLYAKWTEAALTLLSRR
jgi:uncharacterized repeat protein (TIGR02543 family)